MSGRRAFLAALSASGLGLCRAANSQLTPPQSDSPLGRAGSRALIDTPTAASGPAPLVPHPALSFPGDFGAHPEYRTEWWYLTGSLQAASSGATHRFGFQLTFFRSRVDAASPNPSRFAAKQLIVAHAAITDLSGGQLLHDQRIARAGFGLAEAAQHDTQLKLHGWQLTRHGPVQRSLYQAQVQAERLGLQLRCQQTQALLLQGQGAYSRKGPQPQQASYYYSVPQLQVQGQLTLAGRQHQVEGSAWLDHEWSEALLAPEAIGWDWIGMNLRDGSALTAFRLRREDGSTLWSGGSYRALGQAPRPFAHGAVHFHPIRFWTSPATQARYPVEWQVHTPAGRFGVHALLDNQELDSRASTGNVYWEGLSELRSAEGRSLGSGYLEMTGYAGKVGL